MACNFIVRRGAKRISCDMVRLMRHYFAGNIHESALWLAEENPMPVKDFAEFLVRAMPAPLAKLLLKDTLPSHRHGVNNLVRRRGGLPAPNV